MPDRQNPILPGSYLGILGGGQLGRMFTHAAQAMGYKVCVLDPDANSPAGIVADKHIQANYTDSAALKEMASICQAASTEFENVPAKALDELESLGMFVAPRSAGVSIAQDRVAEKKFLATWQKEAGIGPAPYQVLEKPSDAEKVSTELFPGILKTARMGYDGKGQVTVHDRDELMKAWNGFNQVVCVLEKRMDLAFEVSALVVRGQDDEVVAYPIAQNIHKNGILHTTTVPAPSINSSQEIKIIDAAKEIIRRLDYVGVLCVEFFILKNGEVVANEIAPRPHNSGHYTQNACLTSQFEQQVRAMARLPLGSTELIGPSIMLNILGDEWLVSGKQEEPSWEKILKAPSAKLHLYGKAEPRVGRKMGHINFVGKTSSAVESVCQEAIRVLKITR
jgi:5-(carboxyamino)imidazole ribonucleotide synthase